MKKDPSSFPPLLAAIVCLSDVADEAGPVAVSAVPTRNGSSSPVWLSSPCLLPTRTSSVATREVMEHRLGLGESHLNVSVNPCSLVDWKIVPRYVAGWGADGGMLHGPRGKGRKSLGVGDASWEGRGRWNCRWENVEFKFTM